MMFCVDETTLSSRALPPTETQLTAPNHASGPPQIAPRRHASRESRHDYSMGIVRTNVIRYHDVHECVMARGRVVTLQEAGEAFRRLRQRRGWTLEYIEERTGIRKMTLSHLERGNMTPRPSTLTRLDRGMGWPAGTFSRLASTPGGAEALDATLNRLMDDPWAESTPATLPIRQSDEIEVLENYAIAYIETLDQLIANLPDPSSPRSAASTQAALAQCAKAQVLVANSWRVAAATDPASAERLLKRLRELEHKRRGLLGRIPNTLPARLELACRRAELPDPLIAAMNGISSEELWQIRTEGVIPDGLNTRIAAFLKAIGTHGP